MSNGVKWGCGAALGVLLVCAGIGVMAALLGVAGAATSSSSSSSSSATYSVTGTDGVSLASLTYENEQGGTEQQDVSLPWTKTISVKRGGFLYISAQNDTRYAGGISCDITVNGQSFKRSSSSGQGSIATCSGSAP